MVVHGSKDGLGKNGQIKDRITNDQFIKAGKELLKMFDEVDQHKYYFELFAAGKDHLTKEGKTKITVSDIIVICKNYAYAYTYTW